jgi:NADP-dependent aldehyde dehydrogenase
MAVMTSNPATGESRSTSLGETSDEDLRRVTALARSAAPRLAQSGRRSRAALLEQIADAMEACRAELIRTADAETALGETRLNGELSRSVFQFRLFADAVREGHGDRRDDGRRLVAAVQDTHRAPSL